MSIYKEEIYNIYRLRNKQNGIFLTGGRSTGNGIYVSLPALRAVKKSLFKSEDWEIIKYSVRIEGIVE